MSRTICQRPKLREGLQEIHRGDSYSLPARLSNGQQPLDPEEVSEVAFIFGPVIKRYPDEVAFDQDHFIIELSQADTFRLGYKAIPYQVRVLFTDGQTDATDIEWIPISSTLSDVIL